MVSNMATKLKITFELTVDFSNTNHEKTKQTCIVHNFIYSVTTMQRNFEP